MSSTNTRCRYRFVSLTAEGMYVWWFEPQAEAQCSRFSSPNTVYICPYIHQTAMGKGGAGKGAAPKRWPRVLTSADDSWLPWFALICLDLPWLVRLVRLVMMTSFIFIQHIQLYIQSSCVGNWELQWTSGIAWSHNQGSPKTEGSSHFPASGPERGRDDKGCLEGLDVGWCCLILMETGPASLILQEPFLLKQAILEASLTRSSLRHRKHLKAETGDDRLSASHYCLPCEASTWSAAIQPASPRGQTPTAILQAIFSDEEIAQSISSYLEW